MRPFEPVISPAIPFVDGITGGLQPGSILTIDGFVSGNADYFQVNLALGDKLEGSSRSPIALHFNPRFGERYEIVRNAFRDGWGVEETAGINTLKKDSPFQIMILVEPNEFKVAVNGQHFCGYQHRMPFESINTLQIVGDVLVDKILLHALPPPGPAQVTFPAIPIEYPIPNWLAPGRIITILGRPKSFPDRFNVDLYHAESGNICLHFNPRYIPNRYIVRNTCIEGMWGEELTDTPFFNLMPDALFNLKIVCESEVYTIFVNEQHFCYFQHRLPFNMVNHIRIVGDVDIESITFT